MSSIRVVVAEISSVEPHSNADKLQIATVSDYRVIVGLDAKVGDRGLLCLPDTVLAEDVVDLLSLSFLTKNRVRVTKLRGVYSEALFIDEESVEIIMDMSHMKIGSVINEGAFWTKYVSPKERNNPVVPKRGYKIPQADFPEHQNTQQYRLFRTAINNALADPDASVSVSLKYHGTSARSGVVPIVKQLSLWQKRILDVLSDWSESLFFKYRTYLFSRKGRIVNATGSRRVTFGSDVPAFRKHAAGVVGQYLPDGYIAYYEILGMESPTRPIMSPYQGLRYDYGSPDINTIKVYNVLDKDSVPVPPCRLSRVFPKCMVVKPLGTVTSLSDIHDLYLAVERGEMKDGKYDHVDEGLVIRVDSKAGTSFYKYKTNTFLEQEGLIFTEEEK